MVQKFRFTIVAEGSIDAKDEREARQKVKVAVGIVKLKTVLLEAGLMAGEVEIAVFKEEANGKE